MLGMFGLRAEHDLVKLSDLEMDSGAVGSDRQSVQRSAARVPFKGKIASCSADVSCGLRDGYVHRKHDFILKYYIGCCGSTISRCFGAG